MTSQPANHEIAGYMPGRLEFETEYENEAEQSVKDMIFNEDDAPEEVGKLGNTTPGIHFVIYGTREIISLTKTPFV